MASATYRVKQLAELSGVTVRTLHHYDAIGLLTPTRRTSAGHRLYTDADLLRLQQILVHRALGLSLPHIKAVLDDPGFDPRAALREQRAQLRATMRRAEAMIRAVDAALATLEGDTTMNAREIFDGFDPSEHEAEAQQRWGDTDAYRHSQRRTAQYSTEDWARIKAETDDLLGRVAALRKTGAAPTDAAAMELAEEHREQIDRFYYPCSHAMHRGLAQLYAADDRFAQSLDQHGEGVAAFLSAAIEAKCERAARSGV